MSQQCSGSVANARNQVIRMSPWDSLDSWSDYSNRPPANLEEVLYQHFQYWRRQEPPHQLIERFRRLFLDSANYPDRSVYSALFQLAQEPNAEREFKYVLNRCCYTLINLWYTQTRDHWAIPELIKLFEELPTTSPIPEVQRLQHLIQEFVTSEQYAALGRLRQIFSDPKETQCYAGMPVEEQPLAYRLRYYPFLYDSSLLTKDSGQEQKQNICDLRRKTEIDLGIRLARYHSSQRSTQVGTAVANPTLLSSPDLNEAIGYYTGKIDGNRTQKDLARWFATYSKTTRSFRDFKEEFVDYLLSPIAGVEAKYNGNHFSRNFRQFLRETLVEFDEQRLNSFILVETCRRVLSFLVVDSPQRPVFRRFRHLLDDIGYTLTVGLLLRVVLFCSAAKPWLERCFSVLFNLHERRFCKEVPWLVTSLEHTNIALITNFNDIGYQF